MQRSVRTLLAIIAFLAAAPLTAQEEPPSLDGYVLHRKVRERWLNGRQHPAFTPTLTSMDVTHLDLARAAKGGRVLYTRLRRDDGAVLYPAVIELDERGRFVRAGIREPRFPPSDDPATDREVAIRFLRRGLHVDALDLPEVRLWDLVPSYHPVVLEPGMSWVDTIEVTAERLGQRQDVEGARVRTVLGDTLVEGQRLWVIRDSVDVRYAELVSFLDFTFLAEAWIERTAAGVTRGTYLFNPAIGLTQARWDTTRLAGEATLRLPDGRVFTTPARYEAERWLTLMDPEGHAAVRAKQFEERRREWTGPIISPGPLGGRLQQGDAALWDSLLTVWHESRDPDERVELMRSLYYGVRRTPGRSIQRAQLALEAGDTAGAVGFTLAIDPWNEADIAFLLPFMDDPGLTFAFGVDSYRLYHTPMDRIADNPPVLRADVADWPCTPQACRLLAVQVETATEPRLLDLALAMNLAMDPEAWYARVLERAEQGSVLARWARALADGAATWYLQTPPIPDDASDWRAWLEWMGGRLEYLSPVKVALDLYEARTGASLVDTLRLYHKEATSDSARAVFGYLLSKRGGVTAELIAEQLDSGNDFLTAAGRSQLGTLFRSRSEPADSATAMELTDGAVEYVVCGTAVWPGLEELRRWQPESEERRVEQPRSVEEATQWLMVDSLPPEVVARWEGEAAFLSRAEWEARDELLPGVLITIRGVRRWGDFAEVRIEWDGRLDRRDVGTPYRYAAYETLYVRNVDGRWVYVAGGRAIT
jgi:hypothetical protein